MGAGSTPRDGSGGAGGAGGVGGGGGGGSGGVGGRGRAGLGGLQRRAAGVSPLVRQRIKEDGAMERWTADEDASLLRLASRQVNPSAGGPTGGGGAQSQQAPNFILVALMLNSRPVAPGRKRSGRQCAERYAELQRSGSSGDGGSGGAASSTSASLGSASGSGSASLLRFARDGPLHAPWPGQRPAGEAGVTPAVLPVAQVGEPAYGYRREAFAKLLASERAHRAPPPPIPGSDVGGEGNAEAAASGTASAAAAAFVVGAEQGIGGGAHKSHGESVRAAAAALGGQPALQAAAIEGAAPLAMLAALRAAATATAAAASAAASAAAGAGGGSGGAGVSEAGATAAMDMGA